MKLHSVDRHVQRPATHVFEGTKGLYETSYVAMFQSDDDLILILAWQLNLEHDLLVNTSQ